MSNAAQWLRLAALCPLATIGLAWPDALLLAGVLVLTLLVVDTSLAVLPRWSAPGQQIVIAALLAAIVTSASELVLQALCHAQAQTLQPYLPLPIVAAVLFCRANDDSSWGGVLRAGILRGIAFAVSLLMSAVLHALLPEDARMATSLILCGLLLAIVERFAPTTPGAVSPRRPRARVTGPLR